MQIYFRACEKQSTISHVQRFNDYSKPDILKKSWMSLAPQLTDEDKVIFITDALPDETLKFLDNNCNALREFVSVPEHGFDYHLHTVVLIDELEKNIQDNNDLHILVEDDYLFAENALETLRSLNGLYQGFFVPYDYPDRYRTNELCQVVLGKTCHWRSINSATMTVGASAELWKKVIPQLKEAAPTSNDKVFEEFFKSYACISPIPGVATHLTAHHHTPYFPVQKRFDEIKW